MRAIRNDTYSYFFNDDCENVSFCWSFVVSAVFAKRTFDAGFQHNGLKDYKFLRCIRYK